MKKRFPLMILLLAWFLWPGLHGGLLAQSMVYSLAQNETSTEGFFDNDKRGDEGRQGLRPGKARKKGMKIGERRRKIQKSFKPRRRKKPLPIFHDALDFAPSSKRKTKKRAPRFLLMTTRPLLLKRSPLSLWSLLKKIN